MTTQQRYRFFKELHLIHIAPIRNKYCTSTQHATYDDIFNKVIYYPNQPLYGTIKTSAYRNDVETIFPHAFLSVTYQYIEKTNIANEIIDGIKNEDKLDFPVDFKKYFVRTHSNTQEFGLHDILQFYFFVWRPNKPDRITTFFHVMFNWDTSKHGFMFWLNNCAQYIAHLQAINWKHFFNTQISSNKL